MAIKKYEVKYIYNTVSNKIHMRRYVSAASNFRSCISDDYFQGSHLLTLPYSVLFEKLCLYAVRVSKCADKYLNLSADVFQHLLLTEQVNFRVSICSFSSSLHGYLNTPKYLLTRTTRVILFGRDLRNQLPRSNCAACPISFSASSL